MSTRAMGDEALKEMLNELANSDVLEIDLGGRQITPSFADQCIGGLAVFLGLSEFKRRVRIRNVAEDAASLIKHVILKRTAQH